MDVAYLRSIARQRMQKAAADDPKKLKPGVVQTAGTPKAPPVAAPVKPVSQQPNGNFTPSMGDTPEALSVIQRRMTRTPQTSQQPAPVQSQQPVQQTAQQAMASDKALTYASDGIPQAPVQKQNAPLTVSQQPVTPSVSQQQVAPAASPQQAPVQTAQQTTPQAQTPYDRTDDFEDPRYGSDPNKKFEQGGYHAAQWRDYMPEHEKRMKTDEAYRTEHERRMKGSQCYREAFERGKDWLARDKRLATEDAQRQGDLEDDISKYTKDYFITNAREHGDKMRTDAAYRDRHERRMKSDSAYRNAFTNARSEAMSKQYKEKGWFDWGAQPEVDSNWKDKAIDLAETGRKPAQENTILKTDAAQERVDNEILKGKDYGNAADNEYAQMIRTSLQNGSNVRGNKAYVDTQRAIQTLDANIQALQQVQNRTPEQEQQLQRLKRNKEIAYTELNNNQRRLDMEGGSAWRTAGAAALENVVGVADSVAAGGVVSDWMGMDHDALAESGVLSAEAQTGARAAGALAGTLAVDALGGAALKGAGRLLSMGAPRMSLGFASKLNTAMPVLNTRLPAAMVGKAAPAASKLAPGVLQQAQRLTTLGKGITPFMVPKSLWSTATHVAGKTLEATLPVAGAAITGLRPIQYNDYNGARAGKDAQRDMTVAKFTGMSAAEQRNIVRDFAEQRAAEYAQKYVGEERELSDAGARYNYMKHYQDAGADVDAESALAGVSDEEKAAIKSLDGASAGSRSDQSESYHAARKNMRVELQDRAGIKNEGTYWNINPFREGMRSKELKNLALQRGAEEATRNMSVDDLERVYDNKDKETDWWRKNVHMGFGSGLREDDLPQAKAFATKAGRDRAWGLVKEDPWNNTPKVAALWLKTKGMGGLAKYVKNPLVFYGGLAGLLGGGALLLGNMFGGGKDKDDDDDDEDKEPEYNFSRFSGFANGGYGNSLNGYI